MKHTHTHPHTHPASAGGPPTATSREKLAQRLLCRSYTFLLGSHKKPRMEKRLPNSQRTDLVRCNPWYKSPYCTSLHSSKNRTVCQADTSLNPCSHLLSTTSKIHKTLWVKAPAQLDSDGSCLPPTSLLHPTFTNLSSLSTPWNQATRKRECTIQQGPTE